MSPLSSPNVLSVATLRWLDQLAMQGVFATNRELEVLTWNRWLEQHTGRTAESMIGRQLLTEIPELVTRGLDAHYHAALAGEARVLAQSFHRYFLPAPAGAPEPAQTARIAPLEADGVIVGTITVVDDVGERLARERELRHQIETAEFARAVAEEAVRTKDEFLATLSHEIRTPLNAVVGWTRILQTREVDPELLKRALAVIERNASVQMHLIDDMLDMARIMSGKLRLELQPVDAVDMVKSAIDVIAPTARAKGISIETSFAEGLPWVAGDADRLQQVVWNLLSNAVKFTETGGQIRVTVSSQDDMVRIVVSDTGAGIAEDFLPQMFERFRQAHASSSRRHGGLGLGLPLVKQLVELHGGTVTATSVLREGSTFVVSLPALREGQRAVISGLAARADENLAGIRVLVVDAQEDARHLTVTTLQHYGVQASEAADAQAAVAALDAAIAHREPPDAILTDVGLPGEDGFDLMAELRKRPRSRGGDIPVIAMASYSLPRDRQRALAAGFREHVVRPVDGGRLAATLRGVLPGSRRREPPAPR
jgi:signal transduction histidine kinase/CheY-like chemotaxis protein